MLSTISILAVFSTLLLVLIEGGVIDIMANGIQEEEGNISSEFPGVYQLNEAWKELLDWMTSSPKTPRYECPWPFQLIADSCVHFFGSYGTWQKSREYCWALNGDLVTFNNEDNLILMIGYLNWVKKGRCYWVGGSRYNASFDFKWLHGSDLPDTSSPLWNYIDEEHANCVSLSYSDNAYKLENANCTNDYGDFYIFCKLM